MKSMYQVILYEENTGDKLLKETDDFEFAKRLVRSYAKKYHMKPLETKEPIEGALMVYVHCNGSYIEKAVGIRTN